MENYDFMKMMKITIQQDKINGKLKYYLVNKMSNNV